MFETLAYYSLEKEYYKHQGLGTTVFNLKFAIVKFLILGILSWAAGVIVFIKRKSKLA